MWSELDGNKKIATDDSRSGISWCKLLYTTDSLPQVQCKNMAWWLTMGQYCIHYMGFGS